MNPSKKFRFFLPNQFQTTRVPFQYFSAYLPQRIFGIFETNFSFPLALRKFEMITHQKKLQIIIYVFTVIPVPTV